MSGYRRRDPGRPRSPIAISVSFLDPPLSSHIYFRNS
jgi:hypothetical protein